MNHDLFAICQRVNEIQPRLPDGRLLILHEPSPPLAETLFNICLRKPSHIGSISESCLSEIEIIEQLSVGHFIQ